MSTENHPQIPSSVGATSDLGVHDIQRDEGASFLDALAHLATCKRHPPKWAITKIFSLDEKRGELTWNPRPIEAFLKKRDFRRWNMRYANKLSGCKAAYSKMGKILPGEPSRVAINIRFKGRQRSFGAHTLIWIILRGEIPENHEIDHIDRDPWNNRIENLRLCTHSQNVMNQRKRKDCKIGFYGVKKCTSSSKWQADIGLNGKLFYLGTFETPELAALRYDEEARKLHGAFAKQNFPLPE